MRKSLGFLLCLLLLTGCHLRKEEKPFIYSYELNRIEPKHEAKLKQWLEEAKNDKEIKIHSLELKGGYKYSYVRGYMDVEVSFLYVNNEGKLKERFIKGSTSDEVLVKIKYNPTICCTTNIYETDDTKQ